MGFTPMPGIDEDAATTLLPVPPNKPRRLSPGSLMALRSRRLAPSPETQQSTGLDYFDELCHSPEKCAPLPSLLQMQTLHKQKATVRERLHGFALCWGRQEEREVKLREMLPQLYDIFEDCKQNTADEAKEEPEAGPDRPAHIAEDAMTKSELVISDIA